MEKQTSRNKLIREKRLRRRKVILFLWRLLKSFFNWLKCVITFKKTIVVFCLLYVVNYVEYIKRQYERFNMSIPASVTEIIITVFLGQLALTAISSLGSRVVEWAENKYGNGDDINYG